MLDFLRTHIEEIIAITDQEFEVIASYFTEHQHKKGTSLIHQGEKVHHAYFVVEGLLKLIFNDQSGKEHILSFAMENWWESDYYAFYTGADATMTLKCLEDTTVLSITLQSYNELCAMLPKMEHFFLRKANSGHIASQQRILSLLSSSAIERYEQLLKRYPQLLQRVSKTQLASYLGVSRETLSRFYQ